jgi:outer membrane protein TolC
MNLRVPTALARDLPHRRTQSAIGLQVATAGVHLAEINTDYGVQYSYLTYLYARTQQAVLDDSLDNLRRLRKTVRTIVEEGLRGDIVTRDLNTIDSYIAMVQGRREESVKGQARALSALREAMGLPCDAALVLRHDRLLSVKPPAICREDVIALAVARRPEIVQANLGVDVTALEVVAQDKCALNPRQPTFAAGSDLHANPLPAGSYDFDYKPGAVGPEMPTTINGNRRDRVAQAARYLDRSRSVADKARGLISLEAEQAYLRFAEARDKLPRYEEAYRQANIAFEDVKKKFTPENMNVRLDQFISAALVATQMRVSTNEARYQMLLGLALIERVTAGGLPANLGSAPQEKDPE